MAVPHRIRRQQIIRQAEGYLELGMSQHALDALGRMPDSELPDHGLYLRGEALKNLGYYQEALAPLARAAQGSPGNIHIWLALGWCHKRTGRIDLAIEALEEALDVEPGEALIHYNLACYWSISGNKRQALVYLAQALDLNADYRDLVANESDFDPIRSDPTFQALTSVIV